MSRVGLVIVSHSAVLAVGVVEVATQMAPDVTVVAAGGTAAGEIGTDFDAVLAAAERAESGAGVALLYDLGSARMVAELVVESLPGNAVVVDAPLVEGAVAAAVAAQGGADLAAVAQAAVGPVEATETEPTAAAELTVRLPNDHGLHARPAADLAKLLSGLDATVTVRFGDKSADASSILAVMGLGTRRDDQVTFAATGPDAAEAVRLIGNLADGLAHDGATRRNS